MWQDQLMSRAPRVEKIRMVLQRRPGEPGGSDDTVACADLDDLFAKCLERRDTGTLDHIVVEGIDRSGKPRRLMLGFLAIDSDEPGRS